jgi:hypothetical protein
MQVSLPLKKIDHPNGRREHYRWGWASAPTRMSWKRKIGDGERKGGPLVLARDGTIRNFPFEQEVEHSSEIL